MKELSILIPTYNDECYTLVSNLQQQAASLDISYEIIVADDGSSDATVISRNRPINQLPCCKFIERKQNSGRASIRNFLAQQAQYAWLLFIDSDMTMCREDYVKQYVMTDAQVACGGVTIGRVTKDNLRAIYEQSKEQEHTFEKRQQSPYQDFHTANFLIQRDIMLQYPFDERFRYYGYEDVLLGKLLKEHHIEIKHLDNPLSFEVFETNEDFISKTEEGLRTLHKFREELKDYSRLLDFVNQHQVLATMIRWWHRLAAKWERRQLSGNTPSLTLFNLYRLGYYLQL